MFVNNPIQTSFFREHSHSNKGPPNTDIYQPSPQKVSMLPIYFCRSFDILFPHILRRNFFKTPQCIHFHRFTLKATLFCNFIQQICEVLRSQSYTTVGAFLLFL